MSGMEAWLALSLLAVVGFAGWAVTLIFLSKALLPMANALGVIFKVDDLFDKRINAVLDRYREQRRAAAPKVPEQKPTSPLAGFGGPAPLIPDSMSAVDLEQPDSVETEG